MHRLGDVKVKRLGKTVSRAADVGDSVIVAAKIEDACITLADMKTYSVNTSVEDVSLIVNHALGSVPTAVLVTQISSNFLGKLSAYGANTSNVTIGTDKSGSLCTVVCIA